VRAHGDTQLYRGCADLDAACAHLRAGGLPVSDPVLRHFGMRQVHFKDPDGFKVCLQWPATAQDA
jgi:glyoxylase I family protein